MRLFRTEFAHDYSSYLFGYTLHAELETNEPASSAYEQGFLPASADPGVHDRFYMARSIRVPLAEFTPTSENRRILKKFDGQFEADVLNRAPLIENTSFRDCFLSYFADRHGQSVMSAKRLEGILNTALPLRGIRYRSGTLPVAYVLEIESEGSVHYWFSCYDMSYAGSSLGMWLMLDAVRRATKEGREHLYLGTAYGEKGRYKMNITPLEFWGGNGWNTDAKLLKHLIQGDAERQVPHS